MRTPVESDGRPDQMSTFLVPSLVAATPRPPADCTVFIRCPQFWSDAVRRVEEGGSKETAQNRTVTVFIMAELLIFSKRVF